MKKKVLVAALFLFAWGLCASEVSAAFGVLPFNSSYQSTSGEYIKHTETYYLDLAVRFDLWLNFFVGGDVMTWMVTDTTTFKPFFTDYTVNFGWTYSFFEIGYEHQCCHPVNANAYNMKAPILAADKGYDKVYVKLSYKF